MNNKLSKSEFHAEFIHDIIEMEYKANALRTLAGECRRKENEIRKQGEYFCEETKKQIDKNKEKLNRVIRNKQLNGTVKTEYETRCEVEYKEIPRKFWSWMRISLIWIGCFIGNILLYCWNGEIEWNVWILIGMIVLSICLAILINWIIILIKPTKYKSDIVEKQVEKQIVNKFPYDSRVEESIRYALRCAKNNYTQALEQKSQYDKTAEELYTKALYLEKQADILDKNKDKMYDMNIIPPDYRDLVYLFGFYKIFRNNLADTMREAVLLYEERDYREKALNALNRIGNKLGLISEYIMDMSDNLYRIGNDVNFMSGEIQNIRVIQEDNNDQQNEMMREIRATRYANEAVQRSNEQCEWYLHHQYWGI